MKAWQKSAAVSWKGLMLLVAVGVFGPTERGRADSPIVDPPAHVTVDNLYWIDLALPHGPARGGHTRLISETCYVRLVDLSTGNVRVIAIVLPREIQPPTNPPRYVYPTFPQGGYATLEYNDQAGKLHTWTIDVTIEE
jgi:hypothetical protein